MTSEKQIIANQHNAQLSTGAITEEGKIIVAKNAIKHGIFTKDLIIGGENGKENVEEYNQILNGLIQNLAPVGQMEQLLVEKTAVDFWRMKRVLRYETAHIRKNSDGYLFNDDPAMKCLPDSYIVKTIMRYERFLQRSITQNIVMLKQLQLARRQNKSE